MQTIMKEVKTMTNKAYIVANEQQELCVLNEFEKRGYCWINDQGKPISSGVLIARELEDYQIGRAHV